MSTEPLPDHAARWRPIRDRNERRCTRILDAAAPLPIDDLAWHAVPDTEIAAEVLDCLVYMRDVEGFTDRELVGVTAHPNTTGDPLIARFLEVWRREEVGHAEALGMFLDLYAERGDVDVPLRQMPPPPDPSRIERLVTRMGGPVGHAVTAAHMAWGAANELLTLTGYRLLASRCGHRLLAELLTRIAAQEARHYSFYLLQAEWRLAASAVTRAALRQVLRGSWTPVGIGDGYKTPEEFGRVLSYLASGPEGARAMERMDRRFAALPGFSSLRIFTSAAAVV
ncbi:MAG TPA: hypothetical protein VM618_02860 [Acidimicrobiia bacterium]|nr:hypothetical protein [Acidimicrobiia bacterium]